MISIQCSWYSWWNLKKLPPWIRASVASARSGNVKRKWIWKNDMEIGNATSFPHLGTFSFSFWKHCRYLSLREAAEEFGTWLYTFQWYLMTSDTMSDDWCLGSLRRTSGLWTRADPHSWQLQVGWCWCEPVEHVQPRNFTWKTNLFQWEGEREREREKGSGLMYHISNYGYNIYISNLF